MTGVDVEDFDAVFAVFDVNGNGEIAKDELHTIIKRMDDEKN